MPSGWFIRNVSIDRSGHRLRSGNPQNCFGHGSEITGHVPEIVGHDAEITGHALPKYAVALLGLEEAISWGGYSGKSAGYKSCASFARAKIMKSALFVDLDSVFSQLRQLQPDTAERVARHPSE